MKKWLTSRSKVLRRLVALGLACVMAAAVTVLADGAGADTAIKAQANARVVDGGTERYRRTAIPRTDIISRRTASASWPRPS